MKKLALAFMVLLSTRTHLHADEQEFYFDNIVGDVTLIRQGQERPAQPFDLLESGDVIHAKNGSARVVYPDGTRISIGENSQLILQPKVGAADSVQLDDGEVHIQVEKAGTETHKFFINTGTAVMGVRGTEFVVSDNQGETDLHTLSGQVDVGPSKEALAQGKATPVRAEETIHAGRQGTSQVSKFKRVEFMQGFRARHAAMMGYFKKQVRPRKSRLSPSGRLRKRRHNN